MNIATIREDLTWSRAARVATCFGVERGGRDRSSRRPRGTRLLNGAALSRRGHGYAEAPATAWTRGSGSASLWGQIGGWPPVGIGGGVGGAQGGGHGPRTGQM